MARHSQDSMKLVSLDDAKILLERSNAKKIERVLDDVELTLPKGDSYFAELQGNDLHLYGLSQGISRFGSSRSGGSEQFQVTAEGIELSVQRGGVSRIVLHSQKLSRNVDGILREEIDIPVDLLGEYAGLSKKSDLSPEELGRKEELLRQIREDFLKHSHSPRTTSRYRSTPVSSGESRGGGYGRSSG
ncbi:MAG: hypothetical protein KDD70_00215 [Bdellovibrionales bacterium]|nr:hypothetical protein [Bdellovibrionales bacterium]